MVCIFRTNHQMLFKTPKCNNQKQISHKPSYIHQIKKEEKEQTSGCYSLSNKQQVAAVYQKNLKLLQPAVYQKTLRLMKFIPKKKKKKNLRLLHSMSGRDSSISKTMKYEPGKLNQIQKLSSNHVYYIKGQKKKSKNSKTQMKYS